MPSASGDLVAIPCPDVRFESGFAARLERLVASRVRARALRELSGAAYAEGLGHDVVGHRAYALGDDPRAIDWNASARGDELVVRLSRRESGARWSIALDASRSMGVGPPGKLQRAAEIAAGIAAIGLASGARVSIATLGAAGSKAEFEDRGELVRLLARLAGARADGVVNGSDWRAAVEPGLARLVIVGDLFGASPRDLESLARPGRALDVVCVLAPHELAPSDAASPRDRAIEWRDAEGPARRTIDVDARTARGYAQALEQRLSRWKQAAARARARFVVASSTSSFEAILSRLP